MYLNIIHFNNGINLVYLLFLEVNPFSFFLSCSGFDAGPLSLVSSFCSSFGSSFTSSVFTSDFTSAFSGSAFLVSSCFGSSCDIYIIHIYLKIFWALIKFVIIIFSFIQVLAHICPTFYFFCIFFEFWTSLIS